MIRLHPTRPNDGTEYSTILSQRVHHGIDPIDLRRWKRLLSAYQGGDLIDIGALDSPVGPMAKRAYPHARVVAVDHAARAVEYMRSRHPEVEWVQADCFHLPYGDGTFSYAVMGELLEHLEQPTDAVREAMRVLIPEGVLALSVPWEEHREPGAVDGDHHLWSFSKQDIMTLLEPHGRVETKILRSIWFPTYRYCWPQLLVWCQKN